MTRGIRPGRSRTGCWRSASRALVARSSGKPPSPQSSGNVGAAAVAYAARAGLRAVVFVPRTAPEEKLLQAQMYGAEVIRIDHDSPAEIFDLLLWASGEFGWYLVSTAAIYNPFTLEGAKTIAYEIAEQTTFELPDWVIVPVGGGGAIGSCGAVSMICGRSGWSIACRIWPACRPRAAHRSSRP
jgi:threonine synthase